MRKIVVPIVASLLAAVVLLGLYNGLLGVRRGNEEKELLQKMQTLLPGSEVFEEEPYNGEDANIKAVYKAGDEGYVVESMSPNGFGGALDYRPVAAFDRVFDSMFEDFFAPRRSLLSAFDMFGSPMRRMMAPAFPRINIVIGAPETETQAPSQAEAKIPENAGEEVKAARELSALKYQLEEAVKAENFEQAIELRDRIRELEK